jgi:hypothetical protein
MRHFLHNVRRLGSSAAAARRGSRAAPTARLGLEVLEGRDLPSGLSAYSSVLGSQLYQPVAYYQPPTINVASPSPTMLAGKSVTLTQAGNPPQNTWGIGPNWGGLASQPGTPLGVLQITSMMMQPDGSYTFQGVYTLGQQINITGRLGAPQATGLLGVSSCTISFGGSVITNGVRLIKEDVQYTGTVALSRWQAATTSGQLADTSSISQTGDPHNPMWWNPFPGQGPVPASGTFM